MRAIALACAAVLFLPTAARAEDPPFFGWTDLLPATGHGTSVTRSPLCPAGQHECVHDVVAEMTARFDELAERCDHDVIFSVAYLRTTEEYHRASHTPGFFQDPHFVNHEDVVFAEYYFRAYDAWHAGDVSGTPVAWRIAFEAADSPGVSAVGNMFLGASAHINRDLPYVLEEIGLVKPDGSSRKPDHDKVNEFLNRISDELLPEVARRFDPTFDDIDVPGTTLDNFVTFESMLAWRETSWRNAERLAAARTPEERALVAESIEAYAAGWAEVIARSSVNQPGWTNEMRDAYCAEHHDDVM